MALNALAQTRDEFPFPVRKGDTLIGIGQRYLAQPDRWPELKAANSIRNDRRLKPGSVVRVPFALMRWTELTAEVVYAKGAVTSSAGAIRPGMQLKAGDTFDTGADGALTLRLPDGSRATAGIGCHVMAIWMDRSTSEFTHMGGEGVTWIGQAPFTDEKHIFANLGDGTYYHSGILAIRAAIAATRSISVVKSPAIRPL